MSSPYEPVVLTHVSPSIPNNDPDVVTAAPGVPNHEFPTISFSNGLPVIIYCKDSRPENNFWKALNREYPVLCFLIMAATIAYSVLYQLGDGITKLVRHIDFRFRNTDGNAAANHDAAGLAPGHTRGRGLPGGRRRQRKRHGAGARHRRHAGPAAGRGHPESQVTPEDNMPAPVETMSIADSNMHDLDSSSQLPDFPEFAPLPPIFPLYTSQVTLEENMPAPVETMNIADFNLHDLDSSSQLPEFLEFASLPPAILPLVPESQVTLEEKMPAPVVPDDELTDKEIEKLETMSMVDLDTVRSLLPKFSESAPLSPTLLPLVLESQATPEENMPAPVVPDDELTAKEIEKLETMSMIDIDTVRSLLPKFSESAPLSPTLLPLVLESQAAPDEAMSTADFNVDNLDSLSQRPEFPEAAPLSPPLLPLVPDSQVASDDTISFADFIMDNLDSLSQPPEFPESEPVSPAPSPSKARIEYDAEDRELDSEDREFYGRARAIRLRAAMNGTRSDEPYIYGRIEKLLAVPSLPPLPISDESRKIMTELQRKANTRITPDWIRKAKERADVYNPPGFRFARPLKLVVPPISEAWQEKVKNALYAPSGFTVLAKTPEGACLRRHEFTTLVPSTEWLNDEVVNGCLQWLEREMNLSWGVTDYTEQRRRCMVMNSFFWPKIETTQGRNTQGLLRRMGMNPHEFLHLNTILIPICKRYHWTLLVVRPNKREVTYFDSLGPADRSYALLALAWIEDYLGELWDTLDWNIIERDSPRQTNGHDCGVHVVTNAMCAALGLDPMKTYLAEDMPRQRFRLAGVLLNGGFHGDFRLFQ